MVNTTIERAFFYPYPAGRVRLRIHVNQQSRDIGGRKTGGEIDGRSRLSNPALLIRACNDFSHMSISRRDEMNLDNAGQIITSEIHVKAMEGVPRGTEGQRDRATGGRGDGARISSSPPVALSPCLPVALKMFHVERKMFITYL